MASAPNSRSPGFRSWPRLLCALEFERAVLERHLPTGTIVEVCGPGAAGVHRWFEQRGDATDAPRGVVLVGTAGGLSPELPAGAALVADRVVDTTDRTWTATLPLPGRAPRGVVLTVATPSTTPEEKAALHRRFATAAAIDLESAAFAEACTARGWRWSVVRGISDAISDRLPRDVATWIDDRGRLRTRSLMASLARSPRTLTLLPGLRRRSIAALQAAARHLSAAVVEEGTVRSSVEPSP
ncbi:MAG: hypothetical protein ACO3P9_11020 [Phycisphaerales bacterium]